MSDILDRTGLRLAADGIPPQGPDTDLLRLCAEFHASIVECETADTQIKDAPGDEPQRLWSICETTLWAQHSSLIDRIAATPACTLVGLNAKAGVALLVMVENAPMASLRIETAGSETERIVYSLVRDVVRSGAEGLA